MLNHDLQRNTDGSYPFEEENVKEFSEFCAGGGMEQLSGGAKTAIEDKSSDETSNLY